MRLENNLYKIKALNEREWKADISLCRDSIIYRAHFPERPITPGVCIIQIASELLSHILGRKLTLVEVKNAKFLHVISPDEMDAVTYSFQKTVVGVDDDMVKSTVTVTSGDNICAKLSLRYR